MAAWSPPSRPRIRQSEPLGSDPAVRDAAKPGRPALSQIASRTPVEWRLRTRTVDTAAHTLIMGIVNVTPDSFSDGGYHFDPAAAIAEGLAMIEAGADIVDVGGESTRPGAEPVTARDEIERVLPVVATLADAGAVVSIDTMKPEVAAAAIAVGAEIVNDVGGLRLPDMIRVVDETESGIVVMHMRGEPRTMQQDTEYDDVVADVAGHLAQQVEAAVEGGIDPRRICLDPGIGFGKDHTQNLELLDRCSEFTALGFPVLVGASRKGFLGTVLEHAGVPAVAPERDSATAATVATAIVAGASVVRVHDVPTALQAARTTDAIVRGHFEGRESIGRT